MTGHNDIDNLPPEELDKRYRDLGFAVRALYEAMPPAFGWKPFCLGVEEKMDILYYGDEPEAWEDKAMWRIAELQRLGKFGQTILNKMKEIGEEHDLDAMLERVRDGDQLAIIEWIQLTNSIFEVIGSAQRDYEVNGKKAAERIEHHKKEMGAP